MRLEASFLTGPEVLGYITPARKFRMLLHINPTRQRGKRTGSLARASGWYMTFFAAGVIGPSYDGPVVIPPKQAVRFHGKPEPSWSDQRQLELGVTTGLASPSFPYFAVEPLVFLRHVEVPEGIPLAIEVGGS